MLHESDHICGDLEKNGDNSMENVGDAILTVRKICESTNKTKLAMLQEGQYF